MPTKLRIEPSLIHDIHISVANAMKSHIVPVFLNDKSEAQTLDTSKIDLKTTAYTWVPEGQIPRKTIGKLPRCLGTEIITFHTWGYYGLFKPTLYEVFCGIYWALDKDWKKCKYFWLDSGNMGPESIIGNYHFCKCVLWPEESLNTK